VLVAWGFTEAGERVLLAVTLGMRESYEDWQELGRDLIIALREWHACVLRIFVRGLILLLGPAQCWTRAMWPRSCFA
jgi:hypothetical protein